MAALPLTLGFIQPLTSQKTNDDSSTATANKNHSHYSRFCDTVTACLPCKERQGSVWVTSLRGLRWRIRNYFLMLPHSPWMQHKISNIYTCSWIGHISVYQPEPRCSVNAPFYWYRFLPALQALCAAALTQSDWMKWQGELTSADGPVVTPGSQRVCDSLTGDTFRALQHVAVVTAELHAGADSVRRQRRTKRVRTSMEVNSLLRVLDAPQDHHDSSGVFLEPWFPPLPLLFTLLYLTRF